MAHRPRRRASASASTSSRIDAPGRAASASTSTTSTCSRHSVPGLPEAAAARGADAARSTCAGTARSRSPVTSTRCTSATVTADELAAAGACATTTASTACPARPAATTHLEDVGGHMPFIGDGSIGVDVDGVVRSGFPTPSRKLELYSRRCCATGAGRSTRCPPGSRQPRPLGGPRLRRRRADPDPDVPAAHPDPHPLGGNAKWLNEISHGHPLWIHPSDAEQLGIEVNGLVRITTRTGYFVIRAWRTEGIRPGVVGASHHMGRWRLEPTGGAQRWSSGRPASPIPTGRAFGAGGTGASGRWSLTPAARRRTVHVRRPRLRHGSGGPTPASTRT